MTIDIFLAVYLLAAIVILLILSIIAYRRSVQRGDIEEDTTSKKDAGGAE